MYLQLLKSVRASLSSLAAMLLLGCMGMPAAAQDRQGLTQAHLVQRLQAAQGDAALYEQLYKLGGKVASVCANCHGAPDRNTVLEVPYLAGQNPEYLVEQIRQFSLGIRKNAFMEGILRALTPDEMVGMVLFYEKQPLPARIAKDVGLVQAGKQYYQRVCATCHGADGHGNARLPRIAGQHSGYVDLTLRRYRDGSSLRSDPNMAFVTKGMSEREIMAVAAYLETMP